MIRCRRTQLALPLRDVAFLDELERCVALEVAEDELVERLLKRARIEGRSDDTEEAIRTRMREYREKTEPLVEHYRNLGVLAIIQGSGSIEEIAGRIEATIAA